MRRRWRLQLSGCWIMAADGRTSIGASPEAFKDLVAGVRDKKQLQIQLTNKYRCKRFLACCLLHRRYDGRQCNIWSDSSRNLRYSNEAPV